MRDRTKEIVALALGLSVVFSAASWGVARIAQADGAAVSSEARGGGRGGFERDRPFPPGPGRGDYIEAPVALRTVGRQVVRLSDVLRLDGHYRGRGAQHVMVRASSDFGRGRVQLLVNGRPEGRSVLVDRYAREYFIDVLDTRADVFSIDLELDGRLAVDRIGVKLEDGYDDGRPEVVERFVSLRVRDRELIHVRQLLDLGPRFEGREVMNVRVRARVERGRYGAPSAWLQLMVNGLREGMSQRVGEYAMDLRFLPGRDAVLGTELRTLELEAAGDLIVESVAVELRGAGGGFDDTVTRRLGRRTFGSERLDVRFLMDLLGREHEGRRVEYVSVRAREDAGRGLAQLLVNGRPEGQPVSVGAGMSEYVFFLNRSFNELGRDVGQLELHLNGRFDVESMTVRFENDGRGRGDDRDDRGRRPGDRPGPGGPGWGRRGPAPR